MKTLKPPVILDKSLSGAQGNYARQYYRFPLGNDIIRGLLWNLCITNQTLHLKLSGYGMVELIQSDPNLPDEIKTKASLRQVELWLRQAVEFGLLYFHGIPERYNPNVAGHFEVIDSGLTCRLPFESDATTEALRVKSIPDQKGEMPRWLDYYEDLKMIFEEHQWKSELEKSIIERRSKQWTVRAIADWLQSESSHYDVRTKSSVHRLIKKAIREFNQARQRPTSLHLVNSESGTGLLGPGISEGCVMKSSEKSKRSVG
jgi:hypothetical protein